MNNSEFIILEKRCILVNKQLTKGFCDKIIFAIRHLYEENPELPINLVINCVGGYRPAFIVYSFLKSFPGIVRAYVNGECYSAATILLLGCKREYRFSTKYSEFLIHYGDVDAKINFADSVKKRLTILDNKIKIRQREMVSIYKKELTIDTKELMSLLKDTDRYDMRFGPVQAKKYGLISRILKDEEPLPWF